MMDMEIVINGLMKLKEYLPSTMWEPINNAIAILQKQEPCVIEIEGGGPSWWYVCEECHGSVDSSDSFCRHCGRPFRKVVK